MTSRYQSAPAAAGAGTPLFWQTLDAVLDALEDGRLAGDDYLFDAVRQSWQPIGRHPEVAAGWSERMRFRPPAERRELDAVERHPAAFPALSPEGITPTGTPAVSRDLAARAALLRRERDLPMPPGPAAVPAAPAAVGVWMIWLGAASLLLALGFVAWGVLRLAGGLAAFLRLGTSS
jgi:hypothetical protein